mgnify:CR=1 FL=1
MRYKRSVRRYAEGLARRFLEALGALAVLAGAVALFAPDLIKGQWWLLIVAGAIAAAALHRATVQGEDEAVARADLTKAGLRPDVEKVADDAPVGEVYAKWLGMDDPVFDIGITPNRGDALSVRGVTGAPVLFSSTGEGLDDFELIAFLAVVDTERTDA